MVKAYYYIHLSLWESSEEKHPFIIHKCHYTRWKGTDNDQTVITIIIIITCSLKACIKQNILSCSGKLISNKSQTEVQCIHVQ